MVYSVLRIDHMKQHKATYSLPPELLHELNALVEQRKRSHFVAEALKYALMRERHKLEAAYKEASLDSEREKLIEEWDIVEENWDE